MGPLTDFEVRDRPLETEVTVRTTKVGVAFEAGMDFLVGRRNLPSARMRRRLPGYPLPILRLARLAVDERAQGLGVGRALLRHVLDLALDQRDSLGCIGVVTDAKPDAVSFYARYGFEPLEGVREGALHGGATPVFLPLGAADEARRG